MKTLMTGTRCLGLGTSFVRRSIIVGANSVVRTHFGRYLNTDTPKWHFINHFSKLKYDKIILDTFYTLRNLIILI